MAIATLEEYMDTVADGIATERMTEVLDWVRSHYPDLELRIAWNQPMFTHHGTFIVGFSSASKHLSIAPERATMVHFQQLLDERGVDRGKMFIRQPYTTDVDYELLGQLIDFQIEDKRDCTTFWRPKED
ncbi:hypothetical protein C1Y63_00590 [Corynebacterium sp. 13CS0277]|uniref:iron chaperone n=1 Tax=Corynebacterium sp. 13CS0277 TaxID=2071994 RepID=UPI000D024C6D|nr:DUF1801 domain-containing protein [Corynebacterium sp. 13CS0277]PRQ12590.1 hypothetical protein C1Y63_00590 [Corynebacterium sp. 13CS0277]